MSDYEDRFPPRPLAGATLTIDLGALAENYRKLDNWFTGRHVGAAVKANAYGIGIEYAAPALYEAGCRSYFVATLDEGLQLREILPPASEIYVLCGQMAGQADIFADGDLRPVLNDLGQIADWAAHGRNRSKPGKAALHFDTGMARLGLPEYEVRRLLEDPSLLNGIEPTLVMSHLACGDEPDNPINAEQLDKFTSLKARFPDIEGSFANGAGIILGPEYHFDVARAGLALYGGNPVNDRPNPMTEVVHLKAKIVQVREIDSPQAVGYGATHRASGPTRIATVPVGYADGYPRSLGNRGFAVVDGTRVPVVGRVSMDLITLDVTAVAAEKAAPGCEVELLGGAVPSAELAVAADTVDYDLFTRLGRRYNRIYVRKD